VIILTPPTVASTLFPEVLVLVFILWVVPFLAIMVRFSVILSKSYRRPHTGNTSDEFSCITSAECPVYLLVCIRATIAGIDADLIITIYTLIYKLSLCIQITDRQHLHHRIHELLTALVDPLTD